jgi:HD-like signal output (HDOD) protein
MVTLPVLPEVYREISKLDRNPSSDIAEWAAVIDRDPLSSAMVVRRARSPIYGFQSEIVDTKRAVTLLLRFGPETGIIQPH